MHLLLQMSGRKKRDAPRGEASPFKDPNVECGQLAFLDGRLGGRGARFAHFFDLVELDHAALVEREVGQDDGGGVGQTDFRSAFRRPPACRY
jgi:hypothetical protein